MLDEDIIFYAIKLIEKSGAEYVEARMQHTTGNTFIIKNSNIDVLSLDNNYGLGIRYLLNGSLGFLSTNIISKENIKRIIYQSIKKTLNIFRLSEKIKLSEEKSIKKTYSVKQKKKLLDTGIEEKIALLKAADKEMVGTKVNFLGRYLHYSDNVTTEHLITNEGRNIMAQIPRISLFYFLNIKENGKTATRFWKYGGTGGFETFEKLKVNEILINEANTMQNTLRKGTKTPKGITDVVVAPQVVGIMVHESAGHPYEADRIFGREAAQAGESFINSKMIGTKIGSNIVNVVDDPTIKNSYGFFLFDNEGVKSRRKYLIKNGMINEFLHNRETAAYMGIKSNGSSRAVEYDKESIVRMSNTFLLPGEYTEEELISEVKKGIFIKNFTEWNIDDKRLNQKYVGSEAYIIENGNITKPIITPIIETTTPKLWSSVDGIADNTEFHAANCGKGEPMQVIPVWFGGPSMRLTKIFVR